MIVDINVKPKAVLLLNPVKFYLSAEVYVCSIKDGIPSGDVVKYLNQNFGTFVEAVNLVALGEIENLEKMTYNKMGRRAQNSFRTLNEAKENLKEYDVYYYDMSEPKYTWIKLN